MTLARRAYSKAEEISLTTQVGSYCPLCGKSLFRRKNGAIFKDYELAHIYPLNPTILDAIALNGVERLCDDPNDPLNIIPLCLRCHSIYDHPKTREEYETLVQIKRALLQEEEQRALFSEYPIEREIHQIIGRLRETSWEGSTDGLSLDVKSVDDKLDGSMPAITRLKIRHAITDYYPFVRAEFRSLEQLAPATSQLIYGQVKSFYNKQKAIGLSQPDIFRSVVHWFTHPHGTTAMEAPEILASYFIQNCEVFE